MLQVTGDFKTLYDGATAATLLAAETGMLVVDAAAIGGPMAASVVARLGGGRLLLVAPRSVATGGARIADDAAELAAQRWLTELQGSIPGVRPGQAGAHFLTKHSPARTTGELYKRAVYGFEPDGIVLGGVYKFKVNATRFFKYSDMKLALEKAMHTYTVTGQTGRAAIPVPFGRTIGEGFYRTTGQYGLSKQVMVYFNEYGLPITAFPILP